MKGNKRPLATERIKQRTVNKFFAKKSQPFKVNPEEGC